jgi:hypothetical protein
MQLVCGVINCAGGQGLYTSIRRKGSEVEIGRCMQWVVVCHSHIRKPQSLAHVKAAGKRLIGP